MSCAAQEDRLSTYDSWVLIHDGLMTGTGFWNCNDMPFVLLSGRGRYTTPRCYAWLQVVHGFGGKFLGGVTYSAIGKYPRPASAQNRDSCVRAMKVRSANRQSRAPVRAAQGAYKLSNTG